MRHKRFCPFYMTIFIKDRPIRILDEKATRHFSFYSKFDKTIDTQTEMLKVAHLRGQVLLLNVTPITIEKLFHFLENFELLDLQSVSVVPKDKDSVEKRIKKLYTVVKAAGGVVTKNDRFLLMFRRGVWDLPKGKLDDGEKSKKAALREVEEETGVKAELIEKICVTWHTYSQGGQRMLKRTKWYWMRCTDDRKMTPQYEEDIEKLEWLTEPEMRKVLDENSFHSIRYVINSLLDEAVSAN